MPKTAIGLNAKLYLNTGVDYATPTWYEINLFSDVSINPTWDEADASARESRIKQTVKTLLGLEFTGRLKKRSGDEGYEAFMDALLSDDALDLLILDGDKATEGNRGWRCDCQVFSGTEDQAMGNALFEDMVLKPSITENPVLAVKVGPTGTLTYSAPGETGGTFTGALEARERAKRGGTIGKKPNGDEPNGTEPNGTEPGGDEPEATEPDESERASRPRSRRTPPAPRADAVFDLVAFKRAFFDRKAVAAAVDRGSRKALSKFGAFVRTRDQTSMRYRKRPAAPGSPPSVHRSTSFTKATTKPGMKGRQAKSPLRALTFFAYDKSRRSVVIGPAVFRSRVGAGVVPRVVEEGGVSTMIHRRGKVTVGHYAARPHTVPAFLKELPGLPLMLKDAIR